MNAALRHAVAGAFFLFFAATGPAVAQPCAPYVLLGGSAGLALDQPRVIIEVLNGTNSLGPQLYNELLLDTGAERLLVVGNAADELLTNGVSLVNQFEEQGVSGFTVFDVSATYRFDFAGSSGVRQTLTNARFLLNEDLNFGGYSGIVGMPGMVGKVVTLDFSVWTGGNLAYMGVEFTNDLPAGTGHRYSVEVWPVAFPLPTNATPPLPTAAPLPFLRMVAAHQGKRATGDWVLDTGAQVSILSLQSAITAGLDANTNGTVNDEAISFIEIGGIGGTVLAPVLLIDALRLPTQQGVELVWTNASVIVFDIDPRIDGVFGSELLTSGWFDVLFGSVSNGFIQQVRMDFRQFPGSNGTVHLDLTPSLDVVQSPPLMDADNDGVPDCWEIAWFGNTSPDANSDGDGDGLTMFAEFGHGLNPTRSDAPPVMLERLANGDLLFSYLRNSVVTNLQFLPQRTADFS